MFSYSRSKNVILVFFLNEMITLVQFFLFLDAMLN